MERGCTINLLLMVSLLLISRHTSLSWRIYKPAPVFSIRRVVHSITEPSRIACGVACSSHTGCTGFTFNPNKEICDLLDNVINKKLSPRTIWVTEVEYPVDCERYREQNHTQNGEYYIHPDVSVEAPFKVECDLSAIPSWTIIKHNYPNTTEVIDSPDYPNGNVYTILYPGVSMNQIISVTEGRSCKQYLMYECHDAVISYYGVMHSIWTDRNGVSMNYWAGGPKDGYGCACGVDKSCAGGPDHYCNCEYNDLVWRSDGGDVTDTDRLPVTSLVLTDTNGANEKAWFSLGPLVCH